jgi:hypothetical protein
MELGILKYLDRLEVVTEAFFSRQVHIWSKSTEKANLVKSMFSLTSMAHKVLQKFCLAYLK